jgi:hypothetical protein
MALHFTMSTDEHEKFVETQDITEMEGPSTWSILFSA